jgi:hypothetical protein
MDCERIVSGFLGQPANAVSSLAFLVAAAWILTLAFRRERTMRTTLLVLTLAVAANGVGSFALHGPNPSWAHWAHDAAIMAVLLFIAVHAFGRIRGWHPTVQIGAFAIGLAAVGLGLAAIHGASDPFAGTLAAGAVFGEVATVSGGRRTRRPAGPRSGAFARKVGLVGIVLGGVAYLLGQTGSPLCRPESVFQWHALWHVLVAVSLVAYAYVISVRPKVGAASA